MAQHSESFEDIFHSYYFQSNAFLRLNLFLTALMSAVVVQLSTIVAMKFNINSKAMQAIRL